MTGLGNELHRGQHNSIDLALHQLIVNSNKIKELFYQSGANFVVNFVTDYIAHSGLNAARNIGLKAILRHRTNALFIHLLGKSRRKA
ncbi:MAG: hypothetical protein KME64_37535 [Scytonematopsis contorta HA4267-MV1]|nr:hypothetical protein [Scytonematopsis contorta HA4267-MV1]